MSEATDARAYSAERAVVGGMMLDEGAAARAVEQLTGEDFLDGKCRHIFSAALKLASEGRRIDCVTVLSRLGPEARPFVLKAANETPSISGFQQYVDIVLEESRRRQLLDAITRAQMMLIEGGPINGAEQELAAALGACSKSDGGACTAEQAMRETIDELECERKSGTVSGVTSGFADVDYKIGRFQPKGYYIIGARSGMGKTALLLCMVRAAAKDGKRLLVFSLEMPRNGKGGLGTRLLTQETQIWHDTIRFAKYSGEDLQLMNQQAGEPYMNNIVIIDRAGLTIAQIQAAIRRVKPDAVYIDYLGLIKGPKADKRDIEVGLVSQELKNTAKICNIPVVCLVQLNRDTDRNAGKQSSGRPTLGNISESDAVHRDADVVMLLYRESQYNQYADEHRAELIIAKNRQGRTGILPLSWTGETMTFRGVFADGELPAKPPSRPKLRPQFDDVEELM